MSSADHWVVTILDGTQDEATGAIDIDTQGGVVTFRDGLGDVTDFFNLGALASGHRVEPEDDE